MLKDVMQSVIYAECYKQTRYAECRYAESRYAECRGTISSSSVTNIVFPQAISFLS